MAWGTIRVRITVLATAVVATVLILGGASLVLVQRALLTESLDDALTQRAADIVVILSSDPPVTDLSQGVREGFAQLVDFDGNVVVATSNLRNAPPLPISTDDQLDVQISTVSGLEVDDDHFRVLSQRIEGMGVLHVGTTYDVVRETTGVLIGSLSVGIPLIVGALAGLVWWLVGRTLEPVEAIRREVAAIDSTELSRRVPGTGSGDEIDRLSGTMNDMLDRVERAVSRQREFVADASHELRTPLTRMRAAVEVAMAGADLQGQHLAEDVLEEIVGLQHMVEDMLYMARADEGKIPRRFKTLDLDDVVMREVQNARSRPGVTVDLKRVSGAQVTGDAAQLGRAVRNLLANAERHATNNVRLSLSEDDGFAVLLVTDDGPGVPPDKAEMIFERFTRLDEARNADAGGTGLGLAIARQVAEFHGGTLRLLPGDSSGASFEMKIPHAD